MTPWASIVRDILREERISVRRLSDVSGVARSSLKRFLRGETMLQSDNLERLLNVLGYEIDCVQTGKPAPELKRSLKLKAGPLRPHKRIRAVGVEVRF